MLSAWSASRTRYVNVGAELGAFVAGKSGACSVHEREDVLCFGDVGAVATDD